MQTGILKPVPLLATYLSFRLKDGISKSTAMAVLKQLFATADGSRMVLGLSLGLCNKLGIKCRKDGSNERNNWCSGYIWWSGNH